MDCPVVITGLDPRAVSLTRGSALAVSFRNTSSQAISGLAFQAKFGSGRSRAVTLLVRHAIGAGAEDTEQWGDSSWLPRFSSNPQVLVWPQMVLFDNATTWSNMNGADNIVRCSFSTADAEVPLATAGQGSANPAAGQNIGAGFMTAAQKKALIASGSASLLIVHTYPEGAGVAVDGKQIGLTPLTMVLRKLDRPRTIMISKVGYDMAQRTVEPDGSRITLNVTLNSLLDLKGVNGNVRPE